MEQQLRAGERGCAGNYPDLEHRDVQVQPVGSVPTPSIRMFNLRGHAAAQLLDFRGGRKEIQHASYPDPDLSQTRGGVQAIRP